MKRTMVVDASVACKWILPEDGSPHARQVLTAVADGTWDALAPDILLAEIANVIWKKRYLQHELTADEAAVALAMAYATAPRLAPCHALVDQASHLAAALETAVYDCLYLALALAHQPAVLVTADRNFVRRASPVFPDQVRLLADFAAGLSDGS